MKIVYLNPAGQTGGAEAVLLEVLASLKQTHPSWDLTLILGEAGPLARASRP
jgi:hypothetical protein